MRRWLRLGLVGSAIVALAATGIILSRSTTQAATCSDTWIGGSGNFNTPASWSTGVVPTAADDACITATTITTPPALADVYQVSLNGDASVRSLTIGGPNGTQTLLLPASGVQLTLGAASTINSNGVLTMGDAGTGTSALCCAGVSLTNSGNINTVTGGGPANRYVRLNVTNAASGTMVIGGVTVFDDLGGGPTTTVNNGSIAITSGILGLGGTTPSTFINSGGTVSNSSSFYISPGTFVQRAGTETGNPVLLANNTTLDDDLNAGAGNFQFRSGTQTITGTGANPGVAAGQVLTVQSDNSQTSVAKSMTNAGTIILGQAATGTASLCCSGVTLTNTGHLNTVVGGGGNHFLRINLTNASSGTVDIGGPTAQDGGGGGATTTTNNGTLVLEKAETLALTGGSTFTQGFGGTLATTIDATAPPTQTFGGLTGGGGLVTLNGGLLKVTTLGSPWYGSAWPIISSANVLGRFSSLDFGPLNYTVQYSASALTLYGLAPCDYWIGGSGNFNTPSNWSYGTVPSSADDVCIDRNTTTTPKAALDSYTVVVDSTVSVNTLTLGAPTGNQTLQLAGNNTQFYLVKTSSIIGGGILNVGDNNAANGYTWLGSGPGNPVLINAGRLNTVQGGGGTRYLRINLNNFTGGTMDLAATDTRQDMATTTTNNANFTVEAGVTFAISGAGNFTNLQGVVTNNGTFTQAGGTFTERAGSESGNPIVLTGGIFDDDLSGGAAKFTISNPNAPPYTMTGTGTQPGIAAGQVVTIAGNNSWVDIGVAFTNAGTLVLGDNAGNGFSVLRAGTGTSTLTNAGTLKTAQGGGGIRYLRLNVTNGATGTVDIAAADSRLDAAYTFTNSGTFTVEPSATFAISNAIGFTNLAGSVTNNGTFSQAGGTFTERGGSESGNPILLQGAILDDDLTAGPAKFTLNCPNCPPQLITGTSTQPGIAAGQVVTIPSNNTQVDVGVAFTNAGTLNLGDAGNVQNVLRAGNASASLTNTGHLNVVQGGGGVRYLRIPIANAAGGTVDIAAADTRLDAAYTFTNYGTVTVEVAAVFQILNGGAFSNLGGSVTNNGSFSQTGATFTERAGIESGNPVFLKGGVLDDDMSAGSANFIIANPTGTYTLTGTGTQPGVAAGQVVTLAGDNTVLDVGVSLTNAGTLNLGDAGIGWSWLRSTTGVVLTNTGHLNTVQGGGGVRYLRANVTNAAGGTVDLAAADNWQDTPNAIINNGTFIIEPGSTLSLSAGGTFTQGVTGTFQTTIDANATKFGQLNGGGDAVTLDGKLRVITVGHPAVGSSWPIITNAVRSGTFASSDICAPDYNLEYASTSVTLTLRAIYYTTQSTIQEKLTDSDGTTWADMDPARLTLTFTPPADSYAILSGNADLWTSAAGYNQDLGISVSGAGQSVYPTIAGQPEAWKESGGYAGTFSPNAAFVQTVVLLKQGQSYTVKLVWKANRKALGATIWAGAGPIGPKFSPTRLTAQLLPSSTSNLKSATITTQRMQSGSDGATWKDLDPGLSFQYTPCVNGMAVLSGNVDLWTSVRGFNQDVGISVSGGTAYPTKAGQPEAWKESGGFAGTFSPNAAFVQTVIPLNANTTYTIKLSWKANKPSPASAAIWAGAGPIGTQFSPTRLLLQFYPSTGGPAGVVDKATTQQFGQVASDGTTWQNLDALTLPIQSATACTAIISANADLWTDTPGYNQDIGILVLGGGYPTVQLQPEAWKESGGNAGTYSPNAAFVQMVLPMAANTPYTITLQWKANRPSPAFAGIWSGAGPIGSDYSPTRLTVQFLGCT